MSRGIQAAVAQLERAIAAYRSNAATDPSVLRAKSGEEAREIVGRQIALGRAVLGMTQAELGNAIDVSAITISRWETAQRQPDIADLARLQGVGVTLTLPTIFEREERK